MGLKAPKSLKKGPCAAPNWGPRSRLINLVLRKHTLVRFFCDQNLLEFSKYDDYPQEIALKLTFPNFPHSVILQSPLFKYYDPVYISKRFST